MKRNNNQENFKHYQAVHQMLQNNNRNEIVQYLLQNCKIVHRLEDITDDVSISYTNDQCDKINEHTYKRIYGKKPLGVGNKLIFKGKSQFITENKKQLKMRFFKNDEYEIVKENEKTYELKHSISGCQEVSKSNVKKYFKLPFCFTGHSTQGSTIDVPYTIDITSFWCDAEWIWTSLTRCTNWDQITIYYNKWVEQKFKNRVRDIAERLIRGYTEQDFKARRFIKSVDDYVDVDWITENLKSGSCIYCAEPFDVCGGMSNFSVDRIDNSLAHVKNNCQICCLMCNSIKR